MKKIRILCFGDSQTWGYIPGTDHERFSEDIRFPKALQRILGSRFEVIEEGLNSRTLISEDERESKAGRNGSAYLVPCLDSHDPLDLVILMIGTNELKHEFVASAKSIAEILERHFVKVILKRKSQFQKTFPQLLIISPPIINEDSRYAKERYIGANAKSRQLGEAYLEIAERNGCFFIDASSLKVGPDGVHMTMESHLKLAKMIATSLKRTFKYPR